MWGHRGGLQVVKNKVASPFRTAEFDIKFTEGISRIGSLVDLGTELNVLRKSGAFYSFGDQRLGQGRENVKEFLKGHPELTDEIEALIRQNMAEKGAATIAIAATSPSKNGASKPDDEEDDEAEF